MSENPKLDINYNLIDGIKSSAVIVSESSPSFVGQPKSDENSNSTSNEAAADDDELAEKIAEMKMVKTRQKLLNFDYFMSPNWDGRHGIYCSCSSSSGSDEDNDESDAEESDSEDCDNDSSDDFDFNDENNDDYVRSESDEDTDNGEDPPRIYFRSGRGSRNASGPGSRCYKMKSPWFRNQRDRNSRSKKKRNKKSTRKKYHFKMVTI